MGTQPSKTTKQNEKNSLNANFSNEPQSATGSCPAKGYIAIFPVRYAIDESPLSKDTNQGPHVNVMPAGYPTLKTRSYTYRQLRDGWLYVWDAANTTFYEFSIKNNQFTRHMWREGKEVGSDKRHNPLETKNYIEYLATARLYMAYSPIQWTWRQCEKMRSNPHQYFELNAPVADLKKYYASGNAESTTPHVRPLSKLGELVADIKPQKPAKLDKPELQRQNGEGDFTSTMVSTTARMVDGKAMPHKPVFNENEILGNCPDRHSAIMVAVHDPIGILEDLQMNLTGRWSERTDVELINQYKIQTAEQCLRLCGYNIEGVVPKDIQAKQQTYEYLKDFMACFSGRQTDDTIKTETDRDAAMSGAPGLTWNPADDFNERSAKQDFQTKWGSMPTYTTEQYNRWNQNKKNQAQVRMTEMLDYLIKVEKELARYDQHILKTEQDLRAWADHLDISIDKIFLDSTSIAHANHLLDRTQIMYECLAKTTTGQDWIKKQCQTPTSLLGLGLFNFNDELFKGITKLAEEQQQNGFAFNVSTNTSISTRVSEANNFLFDDSILPKTAIYKSMSTGAQQTYQTLKNIVNNTAYNAWHKLAFYILPAISSKFMPRQQVMAYGMMLVSVHIDAKENTSIRLKENKNFDQELKGWQQKMKKILDNIKDRDNIVQNGPRNKQAKAQNELEQLNYQKNKLALEQPTEFFIEEIDHTTKLVTEKRIASSALKTYGQAEVLERLQHRLLKGVEDTQRAKVWVDRELGGILPLVVATMNILNLKSTLDAVNKDGILNKDEILKLSYTAGYTLGAVLSLWISPMWKKYSTLPIEGHAKKLAQFAINDLIEIKKYDVASIAKRLALSSALLTGVAAISAGLEAWEAFGQAGKADNALDEGLLYAKGYVLVGMALVTGAQTVGLLLARWVAFSWVFGPVVNGILLALGIAYLLISSLIDALSRNDLQKWLGYCYWGSVAPNKWPETETGYLQQTNTLYHLLMVPTVQIRPTYTFVYSTTADFAGYKNQNGFWLGIGFPANLSGAEVKVNPLLHYEGWGGKAGDRYYADLFNPEAGVWVKPNEGVWQLPEEKPKDNIPITNAQYLEDNRQRLWQKWLNYSTGATALELEISYPEGFLTDAQGNPIKQAFNYIFRIMTYKEGAADLKTDYFSNTLKDQDDIAIIKDHDLTRVVTFTIP